MVYNAGTFTRAARHPLNLSRVRSATLIAAVLSLSACNAGRPSIPASDTELATGTWGGDNAGVIVLDSVSHVHVGCTYGDIKGRVRLDAAHRFAVAGSYLLRAYPIATGPSMPAEFAGAVDGTRLTLTVTVTDTIEHKVVVLGPVTVRLGENARMGPCPICQVQRPGT
jgi:hypothetical protein